MAASAYLLILLFAFGNCQSRFLNNNCQNDANGNPRTVMVHLFNWKWNDIAAECSRFLGPAGYCGVQVSPPHEHRVVERASSGQTYPWWDRYQPVSYNLNSRSGTEQQFRDMVNTCRDAGVNIYVDVLINHMLGIDAGQGTGSGGSQYDANDKSFPAVPYSSADFNCCQNENCCLDGCQRCGTGSCNIDCYTCGADQVRNCRLNGLLDLALGKEYVRNKVAEYLNKLISYGVKGFRVDAVKHTWPGDVKPILDRLSDQSIYIVNEVIQRQQSSDESVRIEDYMPHDLGAYTNFKFCDDMSKHFRSSQVSNLCNLGGLGDSWFSPLTSTNSLVFIDNHDNQRDHGGGGDILTYKQSKEYKMATAFKMAHPFGFVRMMSSYKFDHRDQGPPANGYDIISPPWNPDDLGQCGEWVCEHRWRQMFNMAKFRFPVRDPVLVVSSLSAAASRTKKLTHCCQYSANVV